MKMDITGRNIGPGVKEEIKSCLYFFANFIKIGVVWLFVNELFP